MNYEQAVEYILSIPKFTKEKSMVNLRLILEHFGNPQERFAYIHVAGTNGKGSVCAYLDSMLRETGIRTGMFTSPHLVSVNERMRIDGEMISEEEFLEIFQEIYDYVRSQKCCLEQNTYGRSASEQAVSEQSTPDQAVSEQSPPEQTVLHPTFFEWVYLMAVIWFARRGVEYAVMETGMGGRLDATNVVKDPVLTVITSISFDHTEILGDTLAKIAEEKAGIIKQGVPVICCGDEPEALEVIAQKAREMAAPLTIVASETAELPEKKMTENAASVPGKALKEGAEEGLKEEAEQVVLPYGARRLAIVKKVLNQGETIDFCLEEMYHEKISIQKNLHAMHLQTGAVYQAMNSSEALMAFQELCRRDARFSGIGEDTAAAGLRKMHWAGRLDEILPGFYVDGAHNAGGAQSLKESLECGFAKGTAIDLIFAVAGDKDHLRMTGILGSIRGLRSVTVTCIENKRAADIGAVADEFRKVLPEHVKLETCEHITQALEKRLGKTHSDGITLCTGSLYLVGSILGYLQQAACGRPEK